MKNRQQTILCTAAIVAGGIFLLRKNTAVSGVGATTKDFVQKYCGLNKKYAPYADIIVAMQTGKYSNFHVVHYARGKKYTGYLATPEHYALFFLNDYDKAIRPEYYGDYPPIEFASISRQTAKRLVDYGLPIETR